MDPTDSIRNELIKLEVKQEKSLSGDPDVELSSICNDEPSVKQNGDTKIDPKIEDEDEEEDALADADLDSREAVSELQSNPAFASITSFFNQFGALLSVKPLSFERLEKLFLVNEADGSINKGLVDLQVMLLRKIRYAGARADKIGMFLTKFCSYISGLEYESLQLSRYGYANLSMSSKLAILSALCDSQFDLNPKLRENIATACKACDLRLIPLGIDKNGLAYWYQQDCDLNVRVYTEEQEDQAGSTWTLIVKTTEQFDALVVRLKSEDLGYKKKELTAAQKEKERKQLEAAAGRMIINTKYGTFIDMYLEEQAMKAKKEARLNEKSERRNKRERMEEKKPQTHSDSDKEDEEMPVAEEHLEEFADRRIMPRRSARAAAVATLHKLATPQRKERVKKEKPVAEEERPQQSGYSSKENSASDDDADDEEDDGDDFESDGEDDDDEFEIKSARKPKGGKRRRRRAPKPDAMASDSESDDEDVVVKERKMANEETDCKKCGKSDRWDVLLLCDNCDDAWHTDCLHPALWFVPDDDWFCPKCVHGMLVERIEVVKEERLKALQKKATQEDKKKEEQERMRRELDYIGISIKNIIPDLNNQQDSTTSSESESEEDDGNTRNRKSKKRAIKKIAPRSTFERQVLTTIAEGRTRRRAATHQVDYSFTEYEHLIKEAVEIEEGGPRTKKDDGRPQGGLGRGKDMANIIEAEQKRRASIDEGTDGEEGEEPARKVGQPARAKQKKQRKKLNDLGSDQSEESASSEYQISEDEEAEAEAEVASGSDYCPSDDGRRRSTRARLTRTQSDDDFVVSDSEESDYGYGRRASKRSAKKMKPKKKKRGRGQWTESDESEQSEESSWSDDSTKKKRKGKGRKKGNSSECEDDSDDGARNQSGRKVRRAAGVAVQALKKKPIIVSDEEEDEKMDAKDGSEESAPKTTSNTRKRKIESDEDEFTPDEEEEEEDVEDEDEEDEEEEMKLDDDSDDEKRPPAKKAKIVADSERRAPPPRAGLNKAKRESPREEAEPPAKKKRVIESDEEENANRADSGEPSGTPVQPASQAEETADSTNTASRQEAKPAPTLTTVVIKEETSSLAAEATSSKSPQPPKITSNTSFNGVCVKSEPLPQKAVEPRSSENKVEASNKPGPPAAPLPASAAITSILAAKLTETRETKPQATLKGISAPVMMPRTSNPYSHGPPTSSAAAYRMAGAPPPGYYPPPHTMHQGMPPPGSYPSPYGPPPGAPIYSPYGAPPQHATYSTTMAPPPTTYAATTTAQSTMSIADPYSDPPVTTNSDDGSLGGALASAMGTDF